MKIHVHCTYKYTLLLTKYFLCLYDKLSVVLTICEGVEYFWSVFLLTFLSRIFRLHGNIYIAGDWLQNYVAVCLAPSAFDQGGGALSCHTCFLQEPRFEGLI